MRFVAGGMVVDVVENVLTDVIFAGVVIIAEVLMFLGRNMLSRFLYLMRLRYLAVRSVIGVKAAELCIPVMVAGSSARGKAEEGEPQ
jgi:hypothetical protein